MPMFPVCITVRNEKGKKESKMHNIPAKDKVEAYEWGERQLKSSGATGVVEVGGTNASVDTAKDLL